MPSSAQVKAPDQNHDRLFLPPLADELERQRIARRSTHKLTYDCFNARVGPGLRVTCRRGRKLHPPSGSGALRLETVLKGAAPSACQDCPHYHTEDTRCN